MLFGLQKLAFQERHRGVQHGAIGSRADIMRDGKSEPCPIVGDPRAYALARMWQPPVLHVTLNELPRRRPQQVLTRHRRLSGSECHAVLQLVAKAVRTARLVEPRARPDAAGERL